MQEKSLNNRCTRLILLYLHSRSLNLRILLFRYGVHKAFYSKGEYRIQKVDGTWERVKELS